MHAGRDVSPTLLRKIAKDIGLTPEQLLGRGELPGEAESERDER